MSEDGCIFTQKSAGNYVVSSILILGTFVAYLPQHIAIFRRRSSAGISVLSIFLSAISVCCNVITSTIDKWNVYVCCYESYKAHQCVANLLPNIQIITGWANTWFLYTIVVAYMNVPPIVIQIKHNEEIVRPGNVKQKKLVHWMWYLAWVLICLNALPAVTAGLLYTDMREALSHYGEALGVVSTLCVLFQWSPQIYKTYQLKDSQSLSILSLFISTAGTFAIVYSQEVQNHAKWTVWVPYLMSAVQHAIIFFMCLYYKIKKYVGNKSSRDYVAINGDDDDDPNHESTFKDENGEEKSYGTFHPDLVEEKVLLPK